MPRRKKKMNAGGMHIITAFCERFAAAQPSIRTDSSILERYEVPGILLYTFCGHKTTPQRYTSFCSKYTGWAMQCYVIVLDTTGMTYAFCEREKTNETKGAKTNQTRKRKNRSRNCLAPPKGMWQTL